MSRIGKSIEIKSRLVVANSWERIEGDSRWIKLQMSIES